MRGIRRIKDIKGIHLVRRTKYIRGINLMRENEKI